MLKFLARLWHWFKGWFVRNRPAATVPSLRRTLTDLEYENALMALLEEAEQGKSWGNLRGVLVLHRLTPDLLAQWLKEHSSRWIEQPEQYQEFARRLLILAQVASGELATVAYAIGTQIRTDAAPLSSPGSPPAEKNTLAVEREREEPANELRVINEEIWQSAILQFQAINYEGAIASCEQALNLQPDDSLAWFLRGLALSMLERYEEALASSEQALKHKPDLHQAWFVRGIAMSNLGRYEEALASSEQALKHKPDFHQAWFPRGNALAALGYKEEAIASYEQTLKHQPDFYQAWGNRGNVLSDLGRYEEAVASYEQALKDQPDDYQIWVNRGITVSKSSNYNPSYQQQFTQHFRFSCTQDSQYIQFNPLNETEAQVSLQASWQASQHLLVETFSSRQVPDALLEAIQCPLPLALAELLQQPPPPELFDLLRQSPSATVLERIHQDSLHHASLSNPLLQQRGYLGELASYQAELDKAIGRETHPEGWGRLHYRIGQAHYRQATRSASPTALWRQAVKSFKTALQVLQPPQFEELCLEVVQDLVRVLLDLHETAEAEELQRRGTDLLQRMLDDPQRSARQKRSLALRFAGFEQLTVNLALQQGDIKGALSLAETSKNTCLRWLLGTDNVPEVSYETIQTLLTQGSALLYWHISPISLTTFLLLPQNAAPLVIQPPDQIPSGSEMFSEVTLQSDEYSLCLRQLLAWEAWLKEWNQEYAAYSTPKGEIAGKGAIPQTQHSWRVDMVNRLNELKAILNVAAIAQHLKENNITQLMLIPHRDLHRFPLHWLLEDYTCTYLPSAHLGLVLKQRHLARSPFQSLLLVENPKSSPIANHKLQKLAPLPFAEVEAALVWHLLKEQGEKGTSHILSNDEQAATHATLTAYLSQPHQVLHFTGHGAYNSLDPAQSCLFLAESDRFSLVDIVSLDLSAYHLVCLAACETAVTGDQTITTEYVGLVSAFLKAQAGCVVSTLWRVESAASAILLVQFYRELQQGQSPSVALKIAQTFLQTATRADLIEWLDWAIPKLPRSLSLLLESERDVIAMMTTEQPYSHPYYWAAFILSGL